MQPLPNELQKPGKTKLDTVLPLKYCRSVNEDGLHSTQMLGRVAAMKHNRTFAFQCLAVALSVPSIWLFVHAGPDVFADKPDLNVLHDAKRFWLAFTAQFFWIGHGLVIIVAILRTAIELGRRGSERHKAPKVS